MATVVFALIGFVSGEAADRKKLKPDGIVIHSYDCRGPGNYRKKSITEGAPLTPCHFMVHRNGAIERKSPEDLIIRHLSNDMNRRSISVMVEGGFDEAFPAERNSESLSPEQQKSLEKLLFFLMQKYDIPLSQIERHMDHDLDSKCPGIGFPYFQLLYSMSLKMMKERGKKTLQEICLQNNLKLPLKKAWVVVHKSAYRLKLFSGKKLLKTYEIALSNRPVGDKLKKGDRKTPVGRFYICEKYPLRAWMEFSYPGIRHAKIGLDKKIISRFEYDKICYAVNSMGIPYHDSDLGNDIGMHAGGFAYGKMRKDYTAGCIGLEDPEAFELYYALPLGTPVIIYE